MSKPHFFYESSYNRTYFGHNLNTMNMWTCDGYIEEGRLFLIIGGFMRRIYGTKDHLNIDDVAEAFVLDKDKYESKVY